MSNVYITAVGAWGDVLAALGNASLLKQRGIGKYNVIYFGYDKNIKTFLEMQPEVDEVIHAIPRDPNHYKDVCIEACCTHKQKWKHWVDMAGLDINGFVIQTHVDFYLQEENPEYCIRKFDCSLNIEVEDFKNPTILFQPYSIQSAMYEDHWPHWLEALDWILNNFEYDVALVGKMNGDRPFGDSHFMFPELGDHPRLINLVGKTKSMMEVFAMAQKCKAIVTTNNCLSMWSIIKDIPAVVMHTRKWFPYFRNWITNEPNKVMDCESTLEEFKEVFICNEV